MLFNEKARKKTLKAFLRQNTYKRETQLKLLYKKEDL